MELEFLVTICLGYGDGGDVEITETVTEEEFELLKQCCREDDEISEFEGLEDLYERVCRAALEESGYCGPEDDEDSEEDDNEYDDYNDYDEYDDASCIVSMPDAVYDAVDGEEKD